MTATMRYVLLQHSMPQALTKESMQESMKPINLLLVVEMPSSHAYQLSALNLRLHKELDKLTATQVPALPRVVAEFDNMEAHNSELTVLSGLDYINELESDFASIEEKSYPLISLLTEIRALQAQLEQWYEEREEGLH